MRIEDVKVTEMYTMIREESSCGCTYIEKGATVQVKEKIKRNSFSQDVIVIDKNGETWYTSCEKLMEALEEGRIYTIKKDEMNCGGDYAFLKKGAKVRLESLPNSHGRVLVQDTSPHPYKEGIWWTDASNLTKFVDPKDFKVGEIYRTIDNEGCYIAKGVNVEIISVGSTDAYVRDLSPNPYNRGTWYIQLNKLIPAPETRLDIIKKADAKTLAEQFVIPFFHQGYFVSLHTGKLFSSHANAVCAEIAWMGEDYKKGDLS